MSSFIITVKKRAVRGCLVARSALLQKNVKLPLDFSLNEEARCRVAANALLDEINMQQSGPRFKIKAAAESFTAAEFVFIATN